MNDEEKVKMVIHELEHIITKLALEHQSIPIPPTMVDASMQPGEIRIETIECNVQKDTSDKAGDQSAITTCNPPTIENIIMEE
jgi:hypothetical protein